MPISQIIMARGTSGGGGGGGSYPVPGDGSYQSYWPSSSEFVSQGTPFVVNGGVASIDNPSAGWIRRTYGGQWSIPGINGNDNPSIFNGTVLSTDADVYGGFGTTSGADNFAMEWKGYIQVFNTGNYNFLIDSDDVAMFWIGDAALDPNFDNKLLWSNNDSDLNANSPNLYSGLYYPVRMRFQEWSGAESCQVYMGLVGSGADLQSMSNWTLRFNGNTGGY
jgi:hypothetical protein